MSLNRRNPVSRMLAAGLRAAILGAVLPLIAAAPPPAAAADLVYGSWLPARE